MNRYGMKQNVSQALPSRTAPFSIGGWLILPESNRICWRGKVDKSVGLETTQTLEPRLMQLLCVLAGNPGQVVGREQLIDHLWPQVVVNENSLTRAISDLRSKLKLFDAQLSVVETIPKRGYRLAVPIQDADMTEAVALGSSIPTTPIAAMTGRHPGLLAGVFSTASMALFLVVMFAGTGNKDVREQNSLQPDIVISDRDRLSDSARYELASNWQPLPRTDLVMPLPRKMTTDDSIASSPDGSLFAYIHQDDNSARLVLGSTRTLQAPMVLLEKPGRITRLQWSPVGHGLLFVHEPTDKLITGQQAGQGAEELMFFNLDDFSLEALIRSGTEQPESGDGKEAYKLT